MKLIDLTEKKNEAVFIPTHVLQKDGQWEIINEQAENWIKTSLSWTALVFSIIEVQPGVCMFFFDDNKDNTLFKAEFKA